ncbi:MAG: histidinol-phosphate transaminase [Bacillota bacterium]
MSKYLNKRTSALTPYVPGEQPKDKKYIKLNTNESPYPPSIKALEAMRSAANDDLRLYPDPDCEELKQTIATSYDVGPQNVFVGNGSDEILAFAFQAFFEPGCKIRFPKITYSFYPVYAELYGIAFETIPLDEEFNIPVGKFFSSEGGVVIPNPNAPTSVALSINEIEKIVSENSEVVVIIDEAYVDFGAESAVSLISKYQNLLVVQTLSKSRSLAGLRVGFAIGSSELIEGLEKIKNSFNSYTLDRIALAGAVASIKDFEYNMTVQKKIIDTREWVVCELDKLGFKQTVSKANFLFVSPPDGDAKKLFERLRKEGVLTRYFANIPNWLRITVGTDAQMKEMLRVIERSC